MYQAWIVFVTLTITIVESNESQQGEGQQKMPNILLIVADDLGMGDVGCYGNDTIHTPNIDRLAKEGAMFTHNIAAASVCTPSRAALLTGRHPMRYGMMPRNYIRVNVFSASMNGLPPEEITLAEMAKDHGYSTAFIGKWHLGTNCLTYGDNCHHPLNQGFDYYYGLPLTNLRDFGSGTEKHYVIHGRFQYMEHLLVGIAVGGIFFVLYLLKMEYVGSWVFFILLLLFSVPSMVFFFLFRNMHLINGIVMRNYDVVEQPVNLDGFTARLVNEGKNFLEERWRDGQPFLLVMSWLQVHTAMHAGSPFKGHSKHGRYGDEVEEMDWSVGEMLNLLDQMGFTNDTFVFFTSDNGGHVEETGYHGNREGGWNGIYRGGKGQGAMDGGIRVPTLVRYPGVIPPGSIIHLPTSTMDVFPTIADIIGSGLPNRTIDGTNLMPLLRDETKKPPHDFFVHYCGDQLHGARYVPGDGEDVYKVHFASPRWYPGTEGCGFICNCHGSVITWHDPPLLFNIQKDPGEKHLLDVNEPKYQVILQEIYNRVNQFKESLEDVPSQFYIWKLLPLPWLQACCNGTFPYCYCRDPVYFTEHKQ